MDYFGILANAVYAIAGIAFLCGFAITAITGSVQRVKVFLWALSAVFTLAIIFGFFFTRGALIFLLFQIIALILVWYMCVVFGAVCGGGLYQLRHRRQLGERLTREQLGDYVPVAEFCAREGIDEERVLARIRSGFYRGGTCADGWYVHRSEQSGA